MSPRIKMVFLNNLNFDNKNSILGRFLGRFIFLSLEKTWLRLNVLEYDQITILSDNAI
jgi:hypothetical protein